MFEADECDVKEEMLNEYAGFLREYPEYDTRTKLQVKKDTGDKDVILPKKKKRGRPRKQRTLTKKSNSNGGGRLIHPVQNNSFSKKVHGLSLI